MKIASEIVAPSIVLDQLSSLWLRFLMLPITAEEPVTEASIKIPLLVSFRVAVDRDV